MNLVDLYNPFVEDDIEITHSGRVLSRIEEYGVALYAVRLRGDKEYLYFIKKCRYGQDVGRVINGKLLRVIMREIHDINPLARIVVLSLESLTRASYLMMRGEILRAMQPELKGEPVWNVNGAEPTV